MVEKFLVFFMYVFSIVSCTAAIACPQATPTNDPGFCYSFKKAAECHCTSSGLPARMCTDMNIIYQRMLAVFGSTQKACEFQHDTTPQNCIDSWNCYRTGGVNTNGEPCSGTGAACA